MIPPPLLDPSTLVTPVGLSTAVTLVLVALLSVLPLRGGHGRHAHAGPGALNVWQLSDTRISHSTQDAAPEPDRETEEIVWPSFLPDSWSLEGSSPLERELAEFLGLGEPETTARLDYVGRHRLGEPVETGHSPTPLHCSPDPHQHSSAPHPPVSHPELIPAAP